MAPSAAPLEHVLPGKRVAEPDSADALVSMHELGSKRPKLEAPVEGLSSSVQPTRVPSFRKPRSKPSKAKMGFGARLHGSRPSIPSSVFEEPNALLGQSSHVENGMAPLAVSCLLKACSQLAALDQRQSDKTTTCLPRNSAFLELKEEEEEPSDSDVEGTTAAAEPAGKAPLTAIEDPCCDIPLVSRLTGLRLADLREGGVKQCQSHLTAAPVQLAGKLGKAQRASSLAAVSQAASLPTLAACCSHMYRPLKAAAVTWAPEAKTLVPAFQRASPADSGR